MDYVNEKGIEIKKTSSTFARCGGNPRVIKKSYICLKRGESSPELEEIKKACKLAEQCDLVSARKYQSGDNSIEALQCYSLRVCNPEKSPLPDLSKKDIVDPNYREAFKRDVASWRRKNMALIEEVRIYYSA